jgi:WD40 repeat protein/serine/threonine protein kinase
MNNEKQPSSAGSGATETQYTALHEDQPSADLGSAGEWKTGDVILDLYQVCGLLGEGGFGKVYRVRHRQWNVDLAVKTPNLNNSDTAGTDAFRREAETWVNLGLHPNVVCCYYVRDLYGIPRTFAEYIDGGSLSDWIRSGELFEFGEEGPLALILDLAIQIAWGLSFAHEHDLVHQDVKPSNVMLTREGVAKITDFGLARSRAAAGRGSESADRSKNAAESSVAMTPAYASPEHSSPGTLTSRSDMWSWGLTVLEMFAGTRFWIDGQTAAEILEDNLDNEEVWRVALPEDVTTLLRACFRRDATTRPDNMMDVANALIRSYEANTGSPYTRRAPSGTAGSAGSINNRALSNLDLGRRDQAVELWRSALAKFPTHGDTICNLNLFLWRSGEISLTQLKERISPVLGNAKTDELAGNWMSLVELESGDLSAVTSLQERLQTTPALAEVRRALELVSAGEIVPNTQLDLAAAGVKRSTIDADQSRSPNDAAAFVNYWNTTRGYLRDARTSLGATTSFIGKYPDRLVLFSDRGKKRHLIRDTTAPEFTRSFRPAIWDHFLSWWAGQLYSSSSWGQFVMNVRAIKIWFLKNVRYGWLVPFVTVPIVWMTVLLYLWFLFGFYLGSVVGLLLIAIRVGYFKLKDSYRGRFIANRSHLSQMNFGCVNSDGTGIVAWCSNHDLNFEGIRSWDISTEKVKHVFEDREGDETSFYLAAKDEAKKPTGLVERVFPVTSMWKHLYHEHDLLSIKQGEGLFTASTLCSSSDQRLVLAGGGDGSLRLYEAGRGEFGDRLVGHGGPVTALAIAGDNSVAVSGSVDSMIRIWDLATNKCQRILRGHQGPVASISIDKEAKQVLSGGVDGRVQLWDISSGRCIRTYENGGAVAVVDLDRSSRTAMSLGVDGRTQFWLTPAAVHEVVPFNLSRVQDTRIMVEAESNFSELISQAENACAEGQYRQALSLIEDARKIAGFDQSRQILDQLERMHPHLRKCGINAAFRSRAITQAGGAPTAIRFAGNGSVALSGHQEDQENVQGTIRSWDTGDGSCRRNFKFGKTVTGIALSHNGRKALTASREGQLYSWDVRTGQMLKALTLDPDGAETLSQAFCVALSRDGRIGVSGGWAVNLWQVEQGICTRKHAMRIRDTPDFIQSIDLNSAGTVALLGERSGSIRFWHLGPNRFVRQPAHSGVVTCVQISPDGATAFTSGADREIKFWDVPSATVKATLGGHAQGVTTFSVDQTHTFLASGDEGGSVKIWDTTSEKCLCTLKAHEAEITAIAFNTTGRYLWTGSRDGSIQEWEIDWQVEVAN